MADVKWIKIAVDIFDDEKILLVEQMPEGYAIISVWFKLLCLAGKQNNSGVFVINDTIPYTEEMFATIFRMPLPIVRLALTTFERFGMVEIVNSTVTIPKWGKHQSLERIDKLNEYRRNYMTEYRERQKLLASQNRNCNDNSNGYCNDYCNGNGNGTVTILEEELEREQEGDIDKRVRVDKSTQAAKAGTHKKFIPPTHQDVQAYCIERGNAVDADRFIDYYTANGWKVGKNSMKDWKAAVRTWEKGESNKQQKPVNVNPFAEMLKGRQ